MRYEIIFENRNVSPMGEKSKVVGGSDSYDDARDLLTGLLSLHYHGGSKWLIPLHFPVVFIWDTELCQPVFTFKVCDLHRDPGKWLSTTTETHGHCSV